MVNMIDLSLRAYDELDALFESETSSSPQGKGRWMDKFGGDDPADETSNIFDLTRKASLFNNTDNK